MLLFDCGVCTLAVALRLLYSNRGMCCALCVCFFLSFFSEKHGRSLAVCWCRNAHSSSEHSTALGHTRYSAAPAQLYNFDAAPAQQYSPLVSPPPTRWPDRNNSRRLTNPRQLPQKVKTTHKLSGLTGWLTTQLIPCQAFSYRDPVPRYLAWAANSMYSVLDRVHFLHRHPAVLALIFIARRIQPLLSLVDRQVGFLCTNELIVLHLSGCVLFK